MTDFVEQVVRRGAGLPAPAPGEAQVAPDISALPQPDPEADVEEEFGPPVADDELVVARAEYEDPVPLQEELRPEAVGVEEAVPAAVSVDRPPAPRPEPLQVDAVDSSSPATSPPPPDGELESRHAESPLRAEAEPHPSPRSEPERDARVPVSETVAPVRAAESPPDRAGGRASAVPPSADLDRPDSSPSESPIPPLEPEPEPSPTWAEPPRSAARVEAATPRLPVDPRLQIEPQQTASATPREDAAEEGAAPPAPVDVQARTEPQPRPARGLDTQTAGRTRPISRVPLDPKPVRREPEPARVQPEADYAPATVAFSRAAAPRQPGERALEGRSHDEPVEVRIGRVDVRVTTPVPTHSQATARQRGEPQRLEPYSLARRHLDRLGCW